MMQQLLVLGLPAIVSSEKPPLWSAQPRLSIRYNDKYRHRRRPMKLFRKLMVVGTILVGISTFTVLGRTTTKARTTLPLVLLAAEATSSSSKQTSTVKSEKKAENVIVVTTILGEWVGVSASTGDVLWKHSTSSRTNNNNNNKGWTEEEWDRLFAPLLSTSSTTKPKLPSNTVAVPSVDGRVFLTPPTTTSTSYNDGSTTTTTTTDLKSIVSGTSIRSLVTKSPFLDSQGRFYVGSRRSTVAAIDCQTGEVLRIIKGEQQHHHQYPTPSTPHTHGMDTTTTTNNNNNNNNNDSQNVIPQSLEGRNIIWIARVDHSITIYNARTGNVDVTFSSSEILSLSDMIGNYMLLASEEQKQDKQIHRETDEPVHDQHHQTHSLESTPESVVSSMDDTIYLLSTPGGKLAKLQPSSTLLDTSTITTTTASSSSTKTNNNNNHTSNIIISWIANQGRSFSSAVAFAVSSETGTSLKVDIIPDAPINTDSAQYLIERFEKQWITILQQQHDFNIRGGVPTKEEEEGTIIVGALQGTYQLFALPLGKRSIEKKDIRTATATTTTSSSPASKAILSGKIPNKQHLIHETTSKLLPSNHMKHQHTSSATSSTSSTSISASQNKALLCAKKCLPTSPTFPACLIGFRNNIIPLPHYNPAEEQQDPEKSLSDDEITNYYIQNFYWIEILIGYRNSSATHRTSYLMVSVTVLFFLSFQLGRRVQRRRQQQEQQHGEVDTTTTSITTMFITQNSEEKSVSNNGSLSPSSIDKHDDMILLQPTPSDNHRIPSERQSSMPQQNLIQVSNEILGYGGHGTVVYQGKLLDGRKVAVKRMLRAYNASADREISLLIESDGHPNVVRYFLKEVRGDFIYLALELCDLSLAELIYAMAGRKEQEEPTTTKCTTASSHLSSQVAWITSMKNTLFQIASGVRHLHSLRIVHRDLKPQNILLALRQGNGSSPNGERNYYIQRQDRVSNEESWKAAVYQAFEKNDLVPKISDMGLGKQLLTGQSSFGGSSIAHPSALNGENTSLVGPGSVGWTAPEVMVLRSKDHMRSFCDQTSSEADSMENLTAPASNLTSRSVDIFSLGCIFYCTLLPGLHPFGEWYEREANIMRSSPKTQPLEEVSAEASALVNSMISCDPRTRPTANEICSHPFFWKPSKRLSFLSDFSDRVELQSDNLERNLLVVRVETNAAAVTGFSWDKALDSDLISNVSRFRTYDPSSVRDLLRMIRNKYHHFCELPDSVKDKIGYSLDDLLHYFESKFPLLLMHCYNLCRDFLPSEDSLILKYGIFSHSANMKISVSQGTGQINGGPGANEGESFKEQTVVDAKMDSLLEVFMPKSEKIDAPHILGVAEDASFCKPPVCLTSEDSGSSLELPSNHISHESIPTDIVVWEGSSTAKLLNCRGWMRSEENWRQRTDALVRKRDINITRCVEDPKFRTRLCNHWDLSKGTYCSMRKKNKCIFAHGPVELRVKEGKRQRWGALVDDQGDNNNPFHSGGEDTYGAARSIECKRKEDGQWVSDKNKPQKPGQKTKGKLKEKEKGKSNA